MRIKKALTQGLTLGAVTALAAGMLAGCSGSNGGTGSSSGGETITITTFGDFGYDDLIKKWNADPDSKFKVKATKVAKWDDWKKTLTQDLQAGSGLTDIVAVEGDSMPAFLAPGASDQFVDLSDSSLSSRWIDYKYKAGQTSDGKLLGLPTDAGPEAFCYRSDLFKKAGLASDPAGAAAYFKDWDTYFKTGQQYVKKVPKSKWYDSSGSIAQAMLNQVKYPFQKADNTIAVDNPDLQRVYKTVTDSIPTLSPKVTQWDPDWQALFKNDGFATIPCPGWMFSYIKTAAPDVKGWNIVDAFPGGGGNWGGSFLSVPKQSKHQKEAAEFAKWLTDADQQTVAFQKAGAYPANAAAEQQLSEKGSPDAYFANSDTAKILADRAKAVPAGVPYKGDKYSDILGLFQTAIQRVDQGKSADASWKTFEQAVQGLTS